MNPGKEQIAVLPFIDLTAQRRRIGEEIDDRIAAVLAHGRFIMGPEVGELEERLCAYSGARHAVTCASGTDALLLALLAWGIGPGDAVFVPGFTFASSAEVVALLGATPVFVDVSEDTFCLDVASLERALEGCSALELRPAAVMPVDLFGQPADYAGVRRVADAHSLHVLADAAQSFGGWQDGRRVGTLGDITATSFFPAKPLGCYGDGGALFTDDDDLAGILRSLRVHGQGTDKYDNVRVGINGRLDTIQAAVLLPKLEILDSEIEARQEVAGRYAEGLGSIVRVPQVRVGSTSAWAQYTVRTPARDDLGEALRAVGVPTAVYYPRPLHLQTAYRDHPRAPGGLPVAEAAAQQVLSLPMHPYLSPQDQAHIVDAVGAAASSER